MIYIVLLLQFRFIGKCVINQKHGLGDEDYKTFYSDVIEDLGYQPNRRRLKRFLHRYFYWILMAISLVWQVALGHKHLLF